MAEVIADDEPTIVDVCPSCRAHATATAAAHMHRLVVTFVCVGGTAKPWSCFARRGHDIIAVAAGHLTQEDALVEVLRELGRFA